MRTCNRIGEQLLLLRLAAAQLGRIVIRLRQRHRSAALLRSCALGSRRLAQLWECLCSTVQNKPSATDARCASCHCRAGKAIARAS